MAQTASPAADNGPMLTKANNAFYVGIDERETSTIDFKAKPMRDQGKSFLPAFKASLGESPADPRPASPVDDAMLLSATADSPGMPFAPGGPILAPEALYAYSPHNHCMDATYTKSTVVDEAEKPFQSSSIGIKPKNDKLQLAIDLKFLNVKYKIMCKGQQKWRGKPTMEKQILHGITGYAASGEMMAMMGPSGSGKTTLLTILAGRKQDAHNIYGSVQYNQLPYTGSLKRRIGFVAQDCVLFPHLTVRETLRFAAMLRLGRDLRKEEKVMRAEEVLSQLGLQRCADTIVGNQSIRGVSGGERKRVSIGQEILIDPSVLFLDEPTSGLDSTIALHLINLLQKFAQEGRTLVTTIHQPSSRIFHMFDKLLLLSEGHGIYFGEARSATTYFSSFGFYPLMPMNPADFLLDLCNGNVTEMSLPSALENSVNASNNSIPLAKESSIAPSTPSSFLTNAVREYLVACYDADSTRMEHLEKAAQREICELRLITSKDDIAQRTSWWEQFVILLVRGMKERRHEYWSALRIIQVVFSAFLSGCLWWRPKQFNPQPQDQLGLLFFIAVFWCYLSLFTAIFTFPLERAILARERASDMYQLSAFFMARTSGDLPFDLGLAIMFMVILYFMTTLKQSFYAFTLTLLTTFLTVITSQGFGLFIGASMMDVQKATTLASILILILMLAGGFFIKNIPSFMSWIKYFSLQAHTFNILIHIQHSNYTITLVPNDPNSPNAVVDTLQGTPFYPAGNSIMALFALAFTYRVLTYISLRCMRY